MLAYQAPAILFNKHLETIYPALLRSVKDISYTRERITTPDTDFLDLDWLKGGSKKLVIISHGLEGNSTRAYVQGMARIFFNQQYDVLAWNYRGCSGEVNKLVRFYHSGATDDLHVVVQHAAQRYEQIHLIGFSLGGNLTLKYLGEQSVNLPIQIKESVVFSVPLHLHTSCMNIETSARGIYATRFLRTLKQKVADKARLMPQIDVEHLDQINTLQDFDDAYTARLHGFSNAIDYYEKCSSLYFLNDIARPTLLVNAQNDPFLSTRCYPVLADHKFLKTEYPKRGGHVGFAQFNKNGVYWSELRALQFIQAGT